MDDARIEELTHTARVSFRAVPGNSGSSTDLLAVAEVPGTAVQKATAGPDASSGKYLVSVDFTSAGQIQWENLTREIYTAQGSDGQPGQLAIVLDSTVVAVFAVQSVMTGR